MGITVAVGARAQFGFSQEGYWGKKQPYPKYFMEFTSESISSEITSLLSNALRPNRSIAKRITGVENVTGDLNAEVSAGTELAKLFKHALGDVTTTSLDNAFVLKVNDATATSAKLTVGVNADGEATSFTVAFTGGTGTGVVADLTDATADTVAELMAQINVAGTGLKAYSAALYDQDGTNSETLDTTDYLPGTTNSKYLGAVSAVELIKNAAGYKDYLVKFGWGTYQHVIDAAANLPEGFTVAMGRDIAEFTYRGCKVNTLGLTANVGDILTTTISLMGAGSTTAARAVADSGNTGNAKNAFKIRYSGTGATCTLQIDKVNHVLTINSATAGEDLVLDISVPWIHPETKVVYPVHTIGGLVSYLNSLSYISCIISDYTDLDVDCSYLASAGPSSINVAAGSEIVFNFDTANLVSEPVTDGDWYTDDDGVVQTVYVNIVGGGVPGTATVRFSLNGTDWGSTYTTSATIPTECRVANNVDTKFTIFFPDNTALQANDTWTIESFRDEQTGATYSTLDPFAGFDGALTLDGASTPIQSYSMTLNNNLFADKFHLGSRARAALPEQRRSVEGTVNVELDNLDFYRKFLNSTDGNLIVTFTSDTYISNLSYDALGNSLNQYSLSIRHPKLNFTGSTPVVGGEELITVDMPFVALYDDTNSIPETRMTIINNSPYL